MSQKRGFRPSSYSYGIVSNLKADCTKETLPYTLAALSGPVLSECPSNEGDIVEGCEPRISSGIHQLKHGHWMSMI